MNASPPLASELAALRPELRARLAHGHFDATRLGIWVADIGLDRDAKNRIAMAEPPAPGDVMPLPARDSDEGRARQAEGASALRAGEVALVVLAGGMATRMGGVVKALVDALPGLTFLEARLAQQAAVAKKYGRTPPLWLMTSEATEGPIRDALGPRLDGTNVGVFSQMVSLRLNPDGTLFRGADGDPSVYPTGHGDVPDALRAAGLLDRFVAGGGKYVVITNLDNLGATLDPLVLGWHAHHGGLLTGEVVEKEGDKGGIPVRNGDMPMICEDMRLPRGFDASQVNVFNANTFTVSAPSLASYAAPWTYVEVEKTVEGRVALQRERLIGELTMNLPTRFLRVPRHGAASRFLPVKDKAELELRRPDIEAVMGAIGAA